MHVIKIYIWTSSVRGFYLFIIFFSVLGLHSSVACGSITTWRAGTDQPPCRQGEAVGLPVVGAAD